jgi:hypothetical protein
MTGIRFSIPSLVEMEASLRRAAEECGWSVAADPQARIYCLRDAQGGMCRLAVWPVDGGVHVAPLGEAGPVDDLLRAARRRARHVDPFLHEGATEAQMSMCQQIPQRIDWKGTKIEDLVGTGKIDAPGG